MRTQKRTDARFCSSRFLEISAALLLVSTTTADAASTSARGADASRISVTAVAGEVDVTMAGKDAAVAPGSTVLLPARIVTGHDGTLGLTQSGTNVSLSNDTDVEIPAEAVDGNLIARLVQHRGNVFYDVATRDVGKLRVETPLLVAVIKGTQFNVAVLEDSTTISLFEGRLEIRTPDGTDVVQLNAGEIAIRSRVDESIRVVGMDDERVVNRRDARPAAADARATEADVVAMNRLSLASDGIAIRAAGDTTVVGAEFKVRAEDVALATGVAVGTGSLDATLDTRLDLGGASVEVALDTRVDLGGGVDLGLDTSVELGAAAADVALDTGVDLGGGSADLGLDTTVDLGAAVVEVGADTGLDLGGALDVGVDAGLDLGGAVDTTVDAGVTVDAGLDLGGALDVGLDVDLGTGTVDLGLGGGTAAPQPAPPAPRGLLGGLL